MTFVKGKIDSNTIIKKVEQQLHKKRANRKAKRVGTTKK